MATSAAGPLPSRLLSRTVIPAHNFIRHRVIPGQGYVLLSTTHIRISVSPSIMFVVDGGESNCVVDAL